MPNDKIKNFDGKQNKKQKIFNLAENYFQQKFFIQKADKLIDNLDQI